MNPPIFLVGPRGCGKTTVGLELARLCQSQFVDTDHWLQENAGKTIADIVEDEGWESFRARETATLEAVTAPSTVIATGGGIILAPYNRQFMREKGVVIYLCAPVSTLVGRLEAFPEEGQRPATSSPHAMHCTARRHTTLWMRQRHPRKLRFRLLPPCVWLAPANSRLYS